MGGKCRSQRHTGVRQSANALSEWYGLSEQIAFKSLQDALYRFAAKPNGAAWQKDRASRKTERVEKLSE